MPIEIDEPTEVSPNRFTPLPDGAPALAPDGDTGAPLIAPPSGDPFIPEHRPAMELTPAQFDDDRRAGVEFIVPEKSQDAGDRLQPSSLPPEASEPGDGIELLRSGAGGLPFRRASAIAAHLGCSTKSIHRRAAKEGWPSQGNGNRREYIPPFEIPTVGRDSVDPSQDPKLPQITFTDSSAHSAARQRALKRERAVIHYLDLQKAGTPVETALRQTAAAFLLETPPFEFSYQRLRAWRDNYAQFGLNGLMDQKEGRVGRKPVARFLSDDQRNQLKADAIEHGSKARAGRNLMRDPELHAGARVALHGGHASKSYLPPSIREAATVSPLTAALHTGARAARLMTSSVHSDPASVKCGDVYVADDETPNVYCWEPWPNRLGYRIGRPQILQVADCASLLPLNIRVVMRASGAYTADDVAGTLGDTFDTPGLPNVGLLLEGGVWRSNSVIGHKSNLSVEDRIGGLSSLGLEVFHARTPMAKWEIEGQFHLQQHIMDKVPGYCGRNERTDLPEKTKKLLAQAERGAVHPSTFLLSLSQFADHVTDALREYSHERQDGKTLRGASPWEKWNDEAPKLRVMKETDRWLYRSALCVTTAKKNGELKVSQGSGRNQRIFYYHNADLICARAGQEIYVYWNDHNPQADAVLLCGTVTNPHKRICIGTAKYVREISRFNAGPEDIGEAMSRKAAELQYAKTELRSLAPHLERTSVPVVADRTAREIGATIAAASERHEEKQKLEATRQRANQSAARFGARASSPSPGGEGRGEGEPLTGNADECVERLDDAPVIEDATIERL